MLCSSLNETEPMYWLTDSNLAVKNKSQDNKYIMLFAHQGSVHVQVCNNLSKQFEELLLNVGILNLEFTATLLWGSIPLSITWQ